MLLSCINVVVIKGKDKIKRSLPTLIMNKIKKFTLKSYGVKYDLLLFSHMIY